MDLSVCICTLNRARSLAGTLRSLVGIELPHGITWEVVVCNNNSTDDTPSVVASFASRLPVRAVDEVHPGIAAARNTAVRESKGRVIAFTDDDIVVSKGWPAALYRACTEKAADIAFGPVTAVWQNAAPPRWLPSFGMYSGVLGFLDYGRQDKLLHSGSWECFIGANMAFRRRVFDELGCFNTALGHGGSLKVGGEETDVFMRALRAGYAIRYVACADVGHVVDPKKLTRRYFCRWYWRHGKLLELLVSPHQGPCRRLLGIPAYMIVNTLRDVRRVFTVMMSGRSVDVSDHVYAAIVSVSRTLAARRARNVEGIENNP